MPVLRRASERLHFSQRGSYSVERLQAFDAYCKQTPLRRAVVVCLAFSLPALLTSIALELIPLQNPFDGVKANHGAWIRLFFIALIGTIALFVQINQLVPQLALSAVRILVSALATACCYMAMMITLASEWIYPIPFGLVIGISPYATLVIVFFLLAVGLRRIRSSASLRKELKQQINIVVAQAMLAVIYPVFIAIYRLLPPTQRLFFVVLLPVIKFLMQQFVAWSAKDLEDCQPGIVVFCVEVFNALYATKSMQSAGHSAHVTFFIIVGFDWLEFALVMKSLHLKLTRVYDLHRQFLRQTEPRADQSLLATTMELCAQPDILSSRMSLIRVHSSICHSISHRSASGLQPIASQRLGSSGEGPSWNFLPVMLVNLKEKHHIGWKKSSMKVQTVTTRSQAQEIMPLVKKQELAHAVLQLLFECEYHLLVEYVECVVPMMYAVYVAIVQTLPSAAYYPETRDLSGNQSQTIVFNLLVYAGIETLWFLLLHAVIKKRCGFSPTYLLAFVLENQALEFQGRLFLWYIFLLEFTLVHFGVDFTLHFAWIHQQKP